MVLYMILILGFVVCLYLIVTAWVELDRDLERQRRQTYEHRERMKEANTLSPYVRYMHGTSSEPGRSDQTE